jgi:Transposase
MRAMLKTQINKTDRNDARGLAQMMRVGLYRPVHVKTLRSQKVRVLLTHRKLLQSKAIAIENDLRATLRNFGLKVGMIGTLFSFCVCFHGYRATRADRSPLFRGQSGDMPIRYASHSDRLRPTQYVTTICHFVP